MWDTTRGDHLPTSLPCIQDCLLSPQLGDTGRCIIDQWHFGHLDFVARHTSTGLITHMLNQRTKEMQRDNLRNTSLQNAPSPMLHHIERYSPCAQNQGKEASLVEDPRQREDCESTRTSKPPIVSTYCCRNDFSCSLIYQKSGDP